MGATVARIALILILILILIETQAACVSLEVRASYPSEIALDLSLAIGKVYGSGLCQHPQGQGAGVGTRQLPTVLPTSPNA